MMDVARDFERMRDYVVGRLSDEELQAFEERLGRDPELVRELEQSLRLREGLEQLRAKGYFTRVAAAPHRVRPWAWLPALAAAAALALVMFLWVGPSRGPSEVPQAPATLLLVSAGAPPAKTFTFFTTRDATTPRLELPASGLVELRAAPVERSAQSDYRVTLLREDGDSIRPVGTVSNVALTADGYVRTYADASHLSPGAYVLRVGAVDEPKAPPAEFRFTLSASDPTPVR